MSLVLQIETATDICSVSIAKEGKTVLCLQDDSLRNHAKGLMPLMDRLFNESGIPMSQLDAIAVSKGPGSFTGLRIGVASAKGLCYALDKPLIGIQTLDSMARYFAMTIRVENALYCPMIDARRKEVYTAIFSSELMNVEPTQALILDSVSFEERLNNDRMVFFGCGAAKFEQMAKNNINALFYKEFNPSAEGMNELALKSLHMGEFENLAHFEPFYLKDFYSPNRVI